MKKRLIFLFTILLGLYLIVVFTRDLFRILGSKERVEEAAQKVEALHAERQTLEEGLKKVETDEFIEKEARDKLLLAKEGEVVVILPEVSEVSEVAQVAQGEVRELANWEKWLHLFFY